MVNPQDFFGVDDVDAPLGYVKIEDIMTVMWLQP
jgi:hypothetical protein